MTREFKKLSRRQLLGGTAAIAGAVVGSRLAGGSLLPSAHAQVAGVKSAVVLIYLDGGYNALFSSADSFLGAPNGLFGVTANNMRVLGNGLAIDAGTFGTLPQVALDNMACIGIRHGITDHFAATRASFTHGNQNAALVLAAAMGGTASIKAAVVGGGPIGGPQAAVEGVSLQQINDMGSTIASLGGSPDPTLPDRTITRSALLAAQTMSDVDAKRSPASLRTLSEGFPAAIQSAAQAPKQFNFAEMAQAYGVGENDTAVNSFTKQMLAAELMILAGTNVVTARSASNWDTHGDRAGVTARNSMNGLMPGLRTFLGRMLANPGFNVTVAMFGDFARSAPGSDHAAVSVATVWGRSVRQGTTGKVSADVLLPATTPNVAGLYAYLGAASKLAVTPFGPNPHNLVKP